MGLGIGRWVLFRRAHRQLPVCACPPSQDIQYISRTHNVREGGQQWPWCRDCRHTMFRARAAGFLVGFGTAGVLAAYQLRQDIVKSHEATLKQVGTCTGGSTLQYVFHPQRSPLKDSLTITRLASDTSARIYPSLVG